MTTAGMTAANPTAHETLRRGDLATLAKLIESHRVRSVDLSAQGRSLWVANGNLIVQGVEPVIGADGVTDVNGVYAFGEVGLESLAARLVSGKNPGPGVNYLKSLRANHTDLFDVIAGYHLRGEMGGEPSPFTSPDSRVHTLRLLRADNSADNEVDGMVRAVLGGRYMAIDSLDILQAVLSGMYNAGVTPDQTRIEADLTESRMVVKVWVPSIQAIAPDVLGGYRSPFTGESGQEVPVVYAGLVFSNSEVGRGAWTVAPRIVYKVCKNGQTITKDAFEKRHVGESLSGDGVIKWSSDTHEKNLALITAKTRDAVATYLDADYLKAKLREIAQAAQVKVTDDPEKIIATVVRHTGHQQARSAILNMYVAGGQMTAGGVMQAYTAAAQGVASADLAYDLENSAMGAMEWVAARASR